jgi:hypothetical protein
MEIGNDAETPRFIKAMLTELVSGGSGPTFIRTVFAVRFNLL